MDFLNTGQKKNTGSDKTDLSLSDKLNFSGVLQCVNGKETVTLAISVAERYTPSNQGP